MRRASRGRGRRALVLLAALGCLAAAGTPAAAQQGENLGGGVVEGTIVFDEPVRIGGACRPTDFTFSGESQSVFVNTVLSAYLGPVEVTGTGRDSCPSGASHVGTVAITASGIGPTGSTLACGTLTGTYARVLTLATVTVSGACTINDFPAGAVEFTAEAVVTPRPALTFDTARFTAPFMVRPDVP